MKQNLTNPEEISLYQDFVADYRGKPLKVIPGTEEIVNSLIAKGWLEEALKKDFCVIPVLEVKDSNDALLELLQAIKEYDYQATLDAIDVFRAAVIEDGVPQIDSVEYEYSEQTLYGKFLD